MPTDDATGLPIHLCSRCGVAEIIGYIDEELDNFCDSCDNELKWEFIIEFPDYNAPIEDNERFHEWIENGEWKK